MNLVKHKTISLALVEHPLLKLVLREQHVPSPLLLAEVIEILCVDLGYRRKHQLISKLFPLVIEPPFHLAYDLIIDESWGNVSITTWGEFILEIYV